VRPLPAVRGAASDGRVRQRQARATLRPAKPPSSGASQAAGFAPARLRVARSSYGLTTLIGALGSLELLPCASHRRRRSRVRIACKSAPFGPTNADLPKPFANGCCKCRRTSFPAPSQQRRPRRD
jgi:hypothetical protein